MRVALVHYWLLGSRGGEKVFEAICRLLPDADIFTLLYDPERVSPFIRSRNVKASFLNPLKSIHRSLLPLMPMALESFDLRSYDLVISSESGPAKGVITSADTRHICYCHTPMRYLWDLYPAYRNDFGQGRIARALMAPVSSYLRTWDYSTAARVDTFLANSWNVRRRIWRAYRRRARVVHPPVDTASCFHKRAEGYFLMVSEMVSYKRLDYAIRAFSRNGRRLKVVGDGPDYRDLKKLAAENIEFCGRVSDPELHDLYARCNGLIMPGEEDFGMTMVESLASGKPVIAFGRGGAVEIVGERGGILYDETSEDALNGALRIFDAVAPSLNPFEMRASASRFSVEVFEKKFQSVLSREPGSSAAPQLEFSAPAR
ncbi:MAG TPA: glycosyltransferase [Bryobacteraceae bacterium]|jgi:glycosyltransferase involved in cell wall biosynthesis|nr:glycosyltransferase [Bryobacteraceae bacterium]